MGKRWELKIASKGKDDKLHSTRVGVVFEGDRGQLQIRIDPGISVSTPEGVLLTGWLPSDDGPRGQRGGNGGPRGGGSSGGYEGAGSGSDDIPFNRIGNVG